VLLFLGFWLCKLPILPQILPCGYYRLCDYTLISTGSWCSPRAATQTAEPKVLRQFKDVFDKIASSVADSDQSVTLPYALIKAEIKFGTFATKIACDDNFKNRDILHLQITDFVAKSRALSRLLDRFPPRSSWSFRHDPNRAGRSATGSQ
jgi:hypothetical protein